MKIVYHPAVQREVSTIVRHYDAISGRLGDAFWEELICLIDQVGASPERFRLVDNGLRRANLKRFPYHFLFRIVPGGIRVIVVRHHRRDPSHGLRRK